MLRDEIADIVRHWREGWHSLDVADAVLALLRERGIAPVPILDLVKSLKEGEEPR